MRIVNPNADQPQAKSAFVTAVAVLFMALSAFGLLVGLQYFLFGSKYEGPEIVDNLAKSGFKRDWLTPDSLKSISRTIQSVSFILNSICLLAAYSLYRRMAWSRVFTWCIVHWLSLGML